MFVCLCVCVCVCVCVCGGGGGGYEAKRSKFYANINMQHNNLKFT